LTALDATLRPFFYASFDEDESRLMLILARYQGRRITTHQLYTYAKEYFRISKDRVYRTVKRFEEERLIFFINDVEGKGARKMILYDYALARYLSKEQPFAVTFDSLIALALVKHGFDFVALGNRGYLLGEELILPSAFDDEKMAWKNAYGRMSLYRKHAIAHVWIVTISNRYQFELGGIVFEGIPFFEWSIVNE
jgi:predicted AAA+ superfamily ATPase